MLTKWGKALDKEHILPEYPRPQFRRSNCEILNGVWEYAITSVSAQIPPERFDGTILVPFSPESELSGVGRTLKPSECLWYHRTIEAPDGFDANTEDLILHFGAVDYQCWVWVNGQPVGEHRGGYLPFTLDVTAALTGSERPQEEIVCYAHVYECQIDDNATSAAAAPDTGVEREP